MASSTLALAIVVYLGGLLLLRGRQGGLLGYLWAAFGLAGLLVLVGNAGGWSVPLGTMQAQALMAVSGWLGYSLTSLGQATLLVPDPSGWSVLQIGFECSTLIEASVFTGLILFYPRLTPQERIGRWGAGLGATLGINLIRLTSIVVMVTVIGKSAVPWAHAIVARLVFFVGIVVVYWRLMTLPTLGRVKRDLEISGRAVL